jgi:endonuclease/exonuclease/phosphatase family metal-dependent hydrolase
MKTPNAIMKRISIPGKIFRGLFLIHTFLFMVACEPLATEFDDTEEAIYYSASSLVAVPDTVSVIRVMTWNIRFGAGRILWFGDACGDRVVLTEDEVYHSLALIADKINEVKPDILLLQEVDIESKRSGYIDQLQWLLDHTWFNYAVCGSQWKAQFIPSDGLGRMDEENAILSRWKISDARRIQLALRNDQDELTRYFYERCCMVTARIEIPGTDNLYAVNIHASATATLDIKQKHMEQFEEELDRISHLGGIFLAGGDLNTLPPGSDTTDFCIQDMCTWESFHQQGNDPYHKEGSDYEPEKHFLDSIYAKYESAVTTESYLASQYSFFTHTTRPGHAWDRTLDYLFTNQHWVANSATTHQEAILESDHAPVSVRFNLPKSRKR